MKFHAGLTRRALGVHRLLFAAAKIHVQIGHEVEVTIMSVDELVGGKEVLIEYALENVDAFSCIVPIRTLYTKH